MSNLKFCTSRSTRIVALFHNRHFNHSKKDVGVTCVSRRAPLPVDRGLVYVSPDQSVTGNEETQGPCLTFCVTDTTFRNMSGLMVIIKLINNIRSVVNEKVYSVL